MSLVKSKLLGSGLYNNIYSLLFPHNALTSHINNILVVDPMREIVVYFSCTKRNYTCVLADSDRKQGSR